VTLQHYKAVIGPVWSKYGFATWDLLVGPEEIVALRYSARESIRLGCKYGLGMSPNPEERIQKVLQRSNTHHLSRLEYKVYPVSDITSIILTNRMSTNTIDIQCTNARRDRFHISRRHDTKKYRELLQSLYPDKYLERGFPASLLGRILKW
jgi:mannitol-specific phosphotransferase system IIBC component